MATSRREFLDRSTRAGAALALAGPGVLPAATESGTGPLTADDGPGRSLRILILGGTGFLGPHQIAAAMARGHAVTTFTRGRSTPTVHLDLYSEVEQLTGDRGNDLSALEGRSWDVAIDNSGYRVTWTRDSARLLAGSVEYYLYTSSTGVYYPYLGTAIEEGTVLVRSVPDGITAEERAEYEYGVMKTLSEDEARRAFGEDRTLVVRPTYMMGPGDTTDRFTYWPVRLSRGGEVLVPGRGSDPVQYLDARDVAGWMIRLLEQGRAGMFNAVGPASATGMHAFVYGAHAAFSSAVTWVPIDDYAFLREHGETAVVPWIMPVGNNTGSARISNRRAIENGLTFTPLAESVRDIHAWWHSGAVPEQRRAWLESDPRSLMIREAGIITAWKGRG